MARRSLSARSHRRSADRRLGSSLQPAAACLGWSTIAIADIADEVAVKVRLLALHQRVGLTELEEAWLVRPLYRDDGLSQPEIARHLDRHKSWVCRLLLLVEALDPAVQADDDPGEMAESDWSITLSDWGKYLGDATLTAAILDRLVMHALRIDIDGPSYRQHVAHERAAGRGAKDRERAPRRGVGEG